MVKGAFHILKKHILMRTNIIVCLIIVVGFIITAFLSYESNYSSSVESLEQVSSLTSDGIYYQLSTIFTRPVNVSMTMANDSLLKEFLDEELNHLEDQEYLDTIARYLKAYEIKYGFDSVFLVSTATGRYYNFNGLDRILMPDNPENDWFFSFLDSDPGLDYYLNVDNDEVKDGNNAITIFVDCKIRDADGHVMGVVGVGVRIDFLQDILRSYENDFGVRAWLIDTEGKIEISTDYTGYEAVDVFELNGLESVREQVLEWTGDQTSRKIWIPNENGGSGKDYIVTRFMPELSWHLLVENNTEPLLRQMHRQVIQNMVVIVLIIVIILLVITRVIISFNRRIVLMTKQQDEAFRKTTEELYDSIHELNITKNRAAGTSTERYFERIGIPGNTPYDQALKEIASRQIKEEFREGYIRIFSTENVLREYESGNTHLRYEFKIKDECGEYYWMRIEANICFYPDDGTIHMFVYRKNIDSEKRQEMQIEFQNRLDEMTGLYTKTATKRLGEELLRENSNKLFAFFIFDIDNFKQANDLHSHAFGDAVILEFVHTLQQFFRKDDLLGRIGGDEFAALIAVPDRSWVESRVREISCGLRKIYVDGPDTFQLSASIGVAMYPTDGTDYNTLYRKADAALYYTKKNGKNGYSIYCRSIDFPDKKD